MGKKKIYKKCSDPPRQLHSQTWLLGIAGDSQSEEQHLQLAGLCIPGRTSPAAGAGKTLPKIKKKKKRKPTKIISTLSPNNETLKKKEKKSTFGRVFHADRQGEGAGDEDISHQCRLFLISGFKKRLFPYFSGNYSSPPSGRSGCLQMSSSGGKGHLLRGSGREGSLGAFLGVKSG